eukprot:TRINITY_DN94298_c0_g1_i1.p1 TRINITY_DN94298_c0_g1~~TRINITY_DN94298_c0_g1_i1.p1  ORF type:complete len:129 (-),score=16.61 TRINITY_DN94298_c0_g1_i1:153-539(-)
MIKVEHRGRLVQIPPTPNAEPQRRRITRADTAVPIVDFPSNIKVNMMTPHIDYSKWQSGGVVGGNSSSSALPSVDMEQPPVADVVGPEDRAAEAEIDLMVHEFHDAECGEFCEADFEFALQQGDLTMD